MNDLLTWFSGSRWRLSFSHCFEMWLVWVPIYLLTFSSVTAGISVVVWYWSRKKIEIENKHGHETNPVGSWSYGWLPWEWPAYYVLDVAMPGIVCVVAYFLLEML